MYDDRDAGPTLWEGTRLHPLAGGYSGETFVAGEGADRVVVRIYARKPDRAAIDASLLHLVRGLIPVPRVLELRHATSLAPAVLVTEYVDGIRLDTALADPGSGLDLTALGAGLGAMLQHPVADTVPRRRAVRRRQARAVHGSAAERPARLGGAAPHRESAGRLAA